MLRFLRSLLVEVDSLGRILGKIIQLFGAFFRRENQLPGTQTKTKLLTQYLCTFDFVALPINPSVQVNRTVRYFLFLAQQESNKTTSLYDFLIKRHTD